MKRKQYLLYQKYKSMFVPMDNYIRNENENEKKRKAGKCYNLSIQKVIY